MTIFNKKKAGHCVFRGCHKEALAKLLEPLNNYCLEHAREKAQEEGTTFVELVAMDDPEKTPKIGDYWHPLARNPRLAPPPRTAQTFKEHFRAWRHLLIWAAAIILIFAVKALI